MAVQIKTLEYFLFNIGGYFDGYNEIRIQGDLFETSKSKQDYNTILPEPSGNFPIALKQEFIEVLNEIHLPKWNRRYYNNDICDGTQWELEIKYNQRKTSKIISGSNAYPTILKIDKELAAESDESYTKEFNKLLKILNKLAGQKNYFQ